MFKATAYLANGNVMEITSGDKDDKAAKNINQAKNLVTKTLKDGGFWAVEKPGEAETFYPLTQVLKVAVTKV